MSSTYVVSDGISGTLTIFCAAGTGTTLSPIVPGSTPTDGTNVMTTLFNLRTGGGSEWNLGVGLRASGAGGSVEAGTATSPLRTDPTGTTPQPATQSGTWTVALAAGTLVIGHVIVDSGTVAATQSGSWTVSVSGTVTVTGTVTLGAGTAVIGHVIVDSGTVAATQSGTWTVALAAGSAVIGHVILDTSSAVIGHVIVDSGAIVVTNGGTFAVQAAQSGTWNIATVTTVTTVATVTSLSQWAGQAIDLGSGTTGAGTLRVVLPTDQTAIPAAQSGTWTVSLAAGTVVIGHVIVDSATLAQLPTALTDAGNLKVALKESTAPIAVTPAGPFTVQTAANAPLLMAGSDYAWRMPAAHTWKVDALGTGQVNVATIAGIVPSFGKGATDAGTARVVLAADQQTLKVDGSAVTQPVTGAVTLTNPAPLTVKLAAPVAVLTGVNAPLVMGGSDYAWRNPSVQPWKVTPLGVGQVNVNNVVTVANATASPVAGVFNQNSATSSVLAVDCTGLATVVMSLIEVDPGTAQLSGGTLAFEADDGTNQWYGMAGLRGSAALTATVETSISLASITGQRLSWRFPIAGYSRFRVRLSQAISQTAGTGTPFASVQLQGSSVYSSASVYASGSLFVSGNVASASANTNNPVKVGGAYNATQPTVADGQIVDLQATARGGLIVATGADTFTVSAVQSGTWNVGTVTTLTGITNVVHVDDNAGSLTVDGTVAATQSGTWNVGTVTTVTTVATVTTITNAVTVVGAAASGATKSGNPVQMGGVFNTTQPTVTTGQAVELQATARGALIIATGADTPVVQVSNVLSVGGSTPGAAQIINPVGIAGVFNTTQPTVTNGQVAQGQSTARGGIIVATGVDTFTVDTELPAAAALADGAAATPTTPTVGVINLLYNGSTMDRQRANWQEVLLAAGVHSTNFSSGSKTNYNARGCIVSVNVTVAGTSTLTLSIAGLNAASANILLAAAQVITGTGMWAIELGPGCSGATNADMRARTAGQLTRLFSVALSHGDASNWTYSISIDYIL